MQTTLSNPVMVERNSKTAPTVTAFICANCARGGCKPSCASRTAPSPPDLGWTIPVHELLVPCTGRLQPEHLLKAFETGADAVCIIGCQKDNCHTLEGSSRCARRADYVRDLLEQIGIGRDKLWLFRLPGSARQDMALGVQSESSAIVLKQQEAAYLGRIEQELQVLRQEIADRTAVLQRSPIHNSMWPKAIEYPVEEDDQSED
jgi:F420-non-reducing hydrogenase iron-sulfur subunit